MTVIREQISQSQLTQKTASTYADVRKKHEGYQIAHVVRDDHNDVRRADHYNKRAGLDAHRDDPRICRRMGSTERLADKSLII